MNAVLHNNYLIYYIINVIMMMITIIIIIIIITKQTWGQFQFHIKFINSKSKCINNSN